MSARGLLLGAVLAVCAAAPAQARDPRGFKGTVEIFHTMEPRAAPGATADGYLNFRGFYNVRGVRSRGRGAAPRTYILYGAGEEDVVSQASFKRSDPESSAEYTFKARSEGVVRLLRRPRGPRQTGGLGLRLRSGGRFMLYLGQLDGGEQGVPLHYELSRSDSQHCITHPAFGTGEMRYSHGVFTSATTRLCPDQEPSEPRRVGSPSRGQTIWGANVWAPSSQPVKQNLCRRFTSGSQNLSVCGKRRRGGLVQGRFAQDGGEPHLVPGGCPFEPWGAARRGPLDGIHTACSVMPVGNADWAAYTGVRWKLRPFGSSP